MITSPISTQGRPLFTFADPLRVAQDSFLIRPLAQPPGSPVAMHVNSLVILGAEPMIVDTGASLFRAEWLEQVFGLVDPDDVRWIFLSHDDLDHTGNLALAVNMCPRATLVTSWFADLRMSGEFVIPPHRQRWIGDGEHLDLPDRRLLAVRPPTFDSPTTRGLYDASTGVYWASDAFGTPVQELVDSVADLPADVWHEAATLFSSLLSPWHTVVDADRFGVWVDRIARLRPEAIASAHGPLIHGSSLDVALARMRGLPHVSPADQPGQDFLDQLIAMLAA